MDSDSKTWQILPKRMNMGWFQTFRSWQNAWGNYTYIYMYICIYIYTYIYVYTYIRIYLYIYISIYLYIYISIYLYIYISIYLYIYISIYLYIYISIYLYMYVRIYYIMLINIPRWFGHQHQANLAGRPMPLVWCMACLWMLRISTLTSNWQPITIVSTSYIPELKIHKS